MKWRFKTGCNYHLMYLRVASEEAIPTFHGQLIKVKVEDNYYQIEM